ncbi:molybdate ABC transporter substrate-binding protein [Campylobacter sp. CCUG 57310]|uniref:molybdate ABC transporter substrate-binding protein n=1 Tax=Campylobacter sp. CCUG 57310 TaxID=2517362 RepID=UPI001565F6EF|nr:molybdate ABC transporter substrate-binding protein [Campylobacter sp. CCUG 57310]QKF91408.1 ABC transporter, periplasmic substrate-binding protein [Campylobacter sp. CCUG 57310]
MKKFLFLAATVCLAFASDALLVGAGGGYKKPVTAVIENLKKDGINVEAAFANIKQITIQAAEGKMAVIVGDEAFLNKSGLAIKGYERLGKGTLALVTPKGKTINDIKDILKFERIAMPDAKKAIYGIRTTEFLKNSNLEKDVGSKMLAVAGVPQVVAYVLNGEVDAGFINSTEAEARRDEFGSVIYVDESLYSPVFISAAKLAACEKHVDCSKFIDELKSERSKEIFAKFGLK